MDPLWASIAELWWIVPVATGAGVFAVLGLRHQRAVDARRLEYDAAKLELRDARTHAWAVRGSVKLARAEVARVQAERAAFRATPTDVAAARRRLQDAQRDARAAAADVRVRRLRVSAARASLAATADPAHRPLARTMAEHDDITARWLRYETDAARLIMFPTMSDGHVPATAAYLTARAEAQQLRPASPQTRMTPIEFVAYRNAVERLARTFEAAEREAWREARASGMAPPEPQPEQPPNWTVTAQQFLERSSAAIAWASENAAAMAARFSDLTAPRTQPTTDPRAAYPSAPHSPQQPSPRAEYPAPPQPSPRAEYPAPPQTRAPQPRATQTHATQQSPPPRAAQPQRTPTPSPVPPKTAPASATKPDAPAPPPREPLKAVWPVPARTAHRPAS